MGFVHGRCARTANDPKLSDRRGWRDRCVVGGKAAAEAAGVTAAPVRCSAWLGVSVRFGEDLWTAWNTGEVIPKAARNGKEWFLEAGTAEKGGIQRGSSVWNAIRDVPDAIPSVPNASRNVPGAIRSVGNGGRSVPSAIPGTGNACRNLPGAIPGTGNGSGNVRGTIPDVGKGTRNTLDGAPGVGNRAPNEPDRTPAAKKAETEEPWNTPNAVNDSWAEFMGLR